MRYIKICQGRKVIMDKPSMTLNPPIPVDTGLEITNRMGNMALHMLTETI